MGLCERFHCLPSQLLAEDVSLLRMIQIVALSQTEKTNG